MLAARGYEVVSAEDGRAALEHLREGRRPDVILLDLMMPGMNGWQFREEQRSDPKLASIPVVVITATRNVRRIQADEVVHKPIKPEHLLHVVERWGTGRARVDAPAAGSAESPRDVARNEPGGGARGAGVPQGALFSDRFVDMLGHDLRNPLSAMSIVGGLLRHQARTPEVTEPAARIGAIVDRMDLMITHLLDFLRVCLGREMPLERRQTDLGDVCHDVIRVLGPSAGREIELAVSGEISGVWDRDRIETVLSTLVADAFDRDQDGGAIRVRIDGSRADAVHLEVSHRGIHSAGLLATTMEARAAGKRVDVEEECTRLGLGMYIAHQIVLAHGGQMHTESGEDTGTRFDITLPRQAPHG